MQLALCRCEASNRACEFNEVKPTDTSLYLLAICYYSGACELKVQRFCPELDSGKQMHKDNCKRHPILSI